MTALLWSAHECDAAAVGHPAASPSFDSLFASKLSTGFTACRCVALVAGAPWRQPAPEPPMQTTAACIPGVRAGQGNLCEQATPGLGQPALNLLPVTLL